jgi:hypothetical protein
MLFEKRKGKNDVRSKYGLLFLKMQIKMHKPRISKI